MSAQLFASKIKTRGEALSGSGILQRQCACGQHTIAGGRCLACDENTQLMPREAGSQANPAIAPPIVHEVLRSPGRPLSESTRSIMDSRFAHDFSAVRVHTDDKASESAQAVDASAYTVGRDIVFAKGRYAPDTPAGALLLAHELTHTIQQRGSSSSSAAPLGVSAHTDASEQAAERSAEAAMHGHAPRPSSYESESAVQRQHEGEEKPKWPSREDFKAAFLNLDVKDPHPINLHLPKPENKPKSLFDAVYRRIEPYVTVRMKAHPELRQLINSAIENYLKDQSGTKLNGFLQQIGVPDKEASEIEKLLKEGPEKK